jgi:hypothetical protein
MIGRAAGGTDGVGAVDDECACVATLEDELDELLRSS